METAPVNDAPALAVKLSVSGQKQQRNNVNFLRDFIQRLLPDRSIIVAVEPVVTPQSSDTIARKVELATKLDPTYQATDFTAWYEVTFEDRISFTAPKDEAAPAWFTKAFTNLASSKEVENLHLLLLQEPPAIDITGDDLVSSQGYLKPAPEGINALFAWTVPGGDGGGASLVDVEQGWNVNHQDLVAKNITMIGGPTFTSTNFRDHGTSVLGIIFMQDNQVGGVGIAPAGTGRIVSEIQNNQSQIRRIFAAINEAILNMNFGDILLVEGQENDPVLVDKNGGVALPDFGKRPLEVSLLTYEIIRLATALGITVIEPAGNKGLNLDDYVDQSGTKRLLRGSSGYQDSGAVMVAAGTSGASHTRWPDSNYGSRIDCYAWGEGVATTSTNAAGTVNDLYIKDFNGTSSASAIVAGAAMTIQSVAQASLGYKLSPLQLRKMLQTGTASQNTVAVDKIGFAQPDLKKILQGSYINALPNMYIRDNILDDGTPSSGIVSASPDIIVRQAAVADPVFSFGQNSNTRNSTSLSQDVIAGKEQSLYIRAQNRGGSVAINAHATVYWSEPTTTNLAQPQIWLNNRIGDVPIPNIPTNNILTVSSRLAWPGNKIPVAGHYCFVAISGAMDDGSPIIPTNFRDFVTFVENNNNVAWRNFNVIPAPPQNRRPYHSFFFTIPGAFDLARIFGFRSIGSLPRGSHVSLKIPISLSRALGIVLRERELVEKEEFALLPLNPFGIVDIGEGLLEKNLLARCELQVQVPVETYKMEGDYEFAIAQVWEGREIGRLTYRFGPLDNFPVKGERDGGGKCGCDCHKRCHHHFFHHEENDC